MKEIELFIKESKIIFSDFNRPHNSNDFEDDPENTEYYKLLRNIAREDLTIDLMGDVAFGPFSSLSSHSLGYYMPRLIEFCLTGLKDVSSEPFMLLFINVIGDNPNSERFYLFKKRHKKAIHSTFNIMKKYYYELIKENGWNKELEMAIEKWDL
ncbi:MAG: hypothetical protein K8S23_06940 [Candidatus Cloacimonetes bacterium]|nr:hypothetical protein [Candidatus Cloacimonadota bacterium]